ncbi:hypothetical protein LV779_14780 [Streptomyces thinghirensis]|nr:hypothetical protein [Streptomyces thinghirensis]
MHSDLNGNIKGVDINEAIGDDRPEKLPTSGQNTGPGVRLRLGTTPS